MKLELFILGFGLFISYSEGFVFISVPSAGNCGEDTVLTCHVTAGSIAFTGWYGFDRNLVTSGSPVRPEDNNKYTETRGTSSFTLTIHNTAITDEGTYKCKNGFEESQRTRLNIECKASAAVLTVTSGKKVVLSIDKLYPVSPSLTASFNNQNSAVTVPGSRTCSSSRQYPGYYKCVWTSSNSLADGSYTYSLVVTTITQADPLTGSLRIVSPQTPVISNVVKLEDNREVVYGNEGQSLTIQCTSSGGFPAPTVVWYKDSISGSNQLVTSSTGTIQGDGTYIVTLQHTFTPTLSDDRKTLICRSYYPQADSASTGSQNKSVILYLSLKPSQPTVTQTAVVSAGDTVEVNCRTAGNRPAANISWSYEGSTTQEEVNATLDTATETYTVVSVFRKQAAAEDNGRNVQCVVTHTSLVSPSELAASVKLNIRFEPSSTHITGNKEMIATGQTALTLACTTGSSNPASDITWKNGSVTLTNSRPYTSSAGDNNGVVRSQQLVLYPTRYMDGDVIICSVSNIVSQSDVEDTITLDLKYSPLVTIDGQQQNTLTEGESKHLSCKVDSEPPANIKWYHDSSLVSQGTPASNVLNYSVTPVNRTHFGDFTCKASNGIGSEQQEQISITVRFKPLTTTITGNSNIIANGKNTLSLVCTSGSSNPISDITWKINNVITPHTGSISDQSGDYGGMKRRQRLTLTPTRDHDGDIISCEANNTIGTSERRKVTLDLRYRPLIQPMSEIIAVEGNNTVLTCVAFSKPASTFKWYRVGQSSIISQGTGILESNKWSYTVNNVRRSYAGTYRCNADNGIETADNGNVLLTVYHPPDVTAVATNTTVKAETALITCYAKGVPNNNYKYGKWTQLWPGYNITVSERIGNEQLELTDLTYEYSGVYTCCASNGIKVFGTNKEFMEGSVLFVVKSFPIITKVSEKTPARLKENATVEVQYYSNIAGSDVKIYRNVNGRRLAGVTYAVSESGEVVDLPVFTHIVRTGGTRARIMIEIQSIEDYGLYDVVVSNEIDSSTRFFEVVPKGSPSKPLDVRVDIIQYNSARLSWIRGYHGGFAQTFVIQLSTDKKNWKDVTVHGGKDESREPLAHVLSGLLDSTTYYVRMYAMNKEGNSPFTENLNYSTPSIIEKECVHTSDRSALIVGIVLGLVIVAVVTYAIYITILLKRRHVYIQKEGISEQTSKQMYVNMPVSAKGGASIMKKTTRGINTFTDETASENQYTELDKTLREQDSAYEAISSM